MNTVIRIAALATIAAAQFTTPSPQQYSALRSDFSIYGFSLIEGSAFSSFADALSTIPLSAVQDDPSVRLPHLQNPLSTQIFLATNPPIQVLPSFEATRAMPSSWITATLSASWPAWVTALPSSLRSDIESFVLSVGSAEQSILTEDLGYTGRVEETAATSTAGEAASTSRGATSTTGEATSTRRETTGGVTSTATSAASGTGSGAGAGTRPSSTLAPGSGAGLAGAGWGMGGSAGVVGVVAALL
ncbi:MAG: hypothetical protein M1820_007209 [Bogoriella megaspora]|nr:MAG: hypothetical protein M1820_007209 [Bogoriella megaspora]